MAEFTVYSFALNLVYCVIAVFILMLLLRQFDRMLGIDFKKDIWREIVEENNAAVAQYMAGRFIGCCILVGSIIS